ILITRSSSETTVAHELAHRFVSQSAGPVQPWLDEGLATYLQTAFVRGDRMWFGRIPDSVRAEWMRSGSFLPVDALLAADYRKFHADFEGLHYASAWLLVHYLLHARSGALRSA